MIGSCPICGDSLSVETDAILGELVDCGSCESELEVVATQPALRLEQAPDTAEDWGE